MPAAGGGRVARRRYAFTIGDARLSDGAGDGLPQVARCDRYRLVARVPPTILVTVDARPVQAGRRCQAGVGSHPGDDVLAPYR